MITTPFSHNESPSAKPGLAIAVRDIAKSIIPADTISHMTLDGGPAGFGFGRSAGLEREAAIERLMRLQPTFKVGIVADATGSMHNDAKDVRENVAPWLVTTLVQTAISTLRTAQAALLEGLSGQLSLGEGGKLMRDGIQLIVTIAATGDSRLQNDALPDKKKSLIDDPPIDILVSKTTVKLTDSSDELETKARKMLRAITDYSPSKNGGANEGESIPEALAAIAGILGPGDQLLPQIGRMIAYYEKYGESDKIFQLVQYLRALGTFTQDTTTQRQQADLLVAITDERPPEDAVLSMQNVIGTMEERTTPLYVITLRTLTSEWKAATAYQNAKFLDLEYMSEVGGATTHPMLPAIELGMSRAVVNSLKLLTD